MSRSPSQGIASAKLLNFVEIIKDCAQQKHNVNRLISPDISHTIRLTIPVKADLTALIAIYLAYADRLGVLTVRMTDFNCVVGELWERQKQGDIVNRLIADVCNALEQLCCGVALQHKLCVFFHCYWGD